ncbi:MAG: sulfite exporter TauE/SafE family protein, partial [Bacillota bacterium]
IIGLFGSLHCIGMCGPIVLALPESSAERSRFIAGRLLYNSGRILSYAFIGLILGLFGSGFAMFGFQQDLSIALGVLILISVVFTYGIRNSRFNFHFSNVYTSKLKSLFSRYLTKKSGSSLFILGILNGFLPCGLVYVAIAGAISTASSIKAALFMASFGLGTLPLMFAVSLFGNFLNINIRRKLNRLIPVFACILALILILRGMNLGIPYISPKLASASHVMKADCCND